MLITTESEATALLKRDKFGKEAVAVTEASFPTGAVIARKIEKEESGARLKMRLKTPEAPTEAPRPHSVRLDGHELAPN